VKPQARKEVTYCRPHSLQKAKLVARAFGRTKSNVVGQSIPAMVHKVSSEPEVAENGGTASEEAPRTLCVRPHRISANHEVHKNGKPGTAESMGSNTLLNRLTNSRTQKHKQHHLAQFPTTRLSKVARSRQTTARHRPVAESAQCDNHQLNCLLTHQQRQPG
jgi:hypothetical protein